MVAPPDVLLVPRFIILLAGLIVPGATVMRAFRLPVALATSFVGSILALYVCILALQLCQIPISFLTLLAGLLVITMVAHRSTPRTEDVAAANPSLLTRSRHYNPLTGMGAWAPLYLLFLAAALWRAWHEPLAGPDVEFRWSFLAEQMLRLGSLDFYPPRSSADFLSYFWVESIPPGAAALHAWAYACAGSSNPAWTIPAVVLQLWALHVLLWWTAQRIGGVPAARFTCLAAAACPLLTWSVLLGQETGLTALSLLGVILGLHQWFRTRLDRWAVFAGISAAVGASAREYGLVFPLLGMAGLIVIRADRRAWLAFLAVGSISLLWPFRTWLLTGNPFYSLTLGGNLPVNERFIAWIEHDAETLGAVLRSSAGWSDITRYLLLCAPTALIGWFVMLAATLRRNAHAAFAFGATIVVLVLWAASVRYTNGGVFYSLRVTSPALVLGVLAAGIGFASVASWPTRAARGSTAVMALLVIGMLPATLALPRNPWRTSPRAWPAFAPHLPLQVGIADETVAVVISVLGRSPAHDARPTGVILADGPGYQRRFLPTGTRVIPLWSPQADWLFDRELPAAEAVRRWRQSEVTHIIVTKWQNNLDFFNARSRWATSPFQVQLVGETGATAIFMIRAVE